MLIRITLITAIIASTAAFSSSKTLGGTSDYLVSNYEEPGIESESCIPDVPPTLPEVVVIALHEEAEFEFIPAGE